MYVTVGLTLIWAYGTWFCARAGHCAPLCAAPDVPLDGALCAARGCLRAPWLLRIGGVELKLQWCVWYR
jgi:hypothetical protein